MYKFIGLLILVWSWESKAENLGPGFDPDSAFTMNDIVVHKNDCPQEFPYIDLFGKSSSSFLLDFEAIFMQQNGLLESWFRTGGGYKNTNHLEDREVFLLKKPTETAAFSDPNNDGGKDRRLWVYYLPLNIYMQEYQDRMRVAEILESKNLYAGKFVPDSEVDAFRRFFLMAKLIQMNGPDSAKEYSLWYERRYMNSDRMGHATQGRDTLMDLWNNDVALKWAKQYIENNSEEEFSNLSDEQIADHALKRIKSGELVVLQNHKHKTAQEFQGPAPSKEFLDWELKILQYKLR